jgi:hypothetical protein
MWPGAVTVVGLAMATGALLTLSLMLPGPQVCATGTGTPRRGARPVSPDRAPACLRNPAKQAKPNAPKRALRALNKKSTSRFLMRIW